MTVADKLLQLNQIKQDIKVAIENKGGDLTGVDFGGYAEKIDEIPLPKEEQIKTVTEPNFGSGNVVVTPDAGKVLTQVTVVKDSDLVPENIVKDVNIFGVVGTAETGGGASGGYTVTVIFYGYLSTNLFNIRQTNGNDFYINVLPGVVDEVAIENVTYVRIDEDSNIHQFGEYTGITEAELIAGKILTNDIVIKMYD